MAKILDATVPLDARYTPEQVQEALGRMLPSLTFQGVPLRVSWYGPTDGLVTLAPFGYRQVSMRLTIEREAGQQRLLIRSNPIHMFRVPLLYRRELRELWSSILDRLQQLS